MRLRQTSAERHLVRDLFRVAIVDRRGHSAWSRIQIVGKSWTAVIYVLAMVAAVIGTDVLFFRNHFWLRLAVNVGIVLVFAAFYFRFLRHS